jgi:glycosyltransferase involved in cell wall biosynthesis
VELVVRESILFCVRKFSIPPEGGTANSIYNMCLVEDGKLKIVLCEGEHYFGIKQKKVSSNLIIYQHPKWLIRPRELTLYKFLLKRSIRNILLRIDVFSKDICVVSRHLYYSDAISSFDIKKIYYLASFYEQETIEFLDRKENTAIKKYYLRFQAFLQKHLEGNYMKHKPKIAVLSNMRRRELKTLHNIPSVVIPPGIDTKKYKITENKKYSEKLNLLIHCRHEVRKNIDYFLKEVARNIDVYIDTKITISGRGPETPYLIDLTSELGIENIVNFLGFVEDPALIMTRSDIFIFPSLQEGYGQVVIEAMASGLPVIVYSNVQVPSNELVKDGVNGFQVEYGIDNSITTAVKVYLSNRDTLIEHSNSCSNAQYMTWENTLNQLIKEAV